MGTCKTIRLQRTNKYIQTCCVSTVKWCRVVLLTTPRHRQTTKCCPLFLETCSIPLLGSLLVWVYLCNEKHIYYGTFNTFKVKLLCSSSPIMGNMGNCQLMKSTNSTWENVDYCWASIYNIGHDDSYSVIILVPCNNMDCLHMTEDMSQMVIKFRLCCIFNHHCISRVTFIF